MAQVSVTIQPKNKTMEFDVYKPGTHWTDLLQFRCFTNWKNKQHLACIQLLKLKNEGLKKRLKPSIVIN